MSSGGQMLSSRCSAPCEVTCPQPFANVCSQPCVTSCGDSRAVIYPPPVLINFPGPILNSCPQESSIVGTSIPQPYGPAIQYGSEESHGMGGSVGMSGKGVSFGAGGASGTGVSCNPFFLQLLLTLHHAFPGGVEIF
uniref:Keratin n=1 Tax=Phasianus colchicus TaxID=9054 RepID=A0A669R290_PHACC